MFGLATEFGHCIGKTQRTSNRTTQQDMTMTTPRRPSNPKDAAEALFTKPKKVAAPAVERPTIPAQGVGLIEDRQRYPRAFSGGRSRLARAHKRNLASRNECPTRLLKGFEPPLRLLNWATARASRMIHLLRSTIQSVRRPPVLSPTRLIPIGRDPRSECPEFRRHLRVLF